MPQIASNNDVLMISEMKTNKSFPTSQCLIDGFSSLNDLDRNFKWRWHFSVFQK